VGLQGAELASSWCPLLLCGNTFDPQSTTFPDVFELNRCCFVRTLLSYSGASVADGGTILRPDLAREMPTVTPDGLTWTFRLRPGVRYAPPFADTEIVAADLVRSFERAFSSAGVAVPWAEGGPIGGFFVDGYLVDLIEGGRAFLRGEVEHVTGIEAPDAHTLVFHLTRPAGDFANLVALPGFGPIPANPARPDDAFGVAQGHDFDYGTVIVSTGPYMFEGSEALRFDLEPEDQLPPVGNRPDIATLVRNPSWSSAVDPVRTPRPDRIVFYLVGSAEEAQALVRTGALDLVLNEPAPMTATARWLEDADLRPRVVLSPADGMRFLSLNLAVRPFDDVHVRRAMNLVVDRAAVARAMEGGGSDYGQDPFTHLALDSYEDNLLLTYAPPEVEAGGNVTAARAEMGRSAYDADGDGRCDAAVCGGLKLFARAATPFAVDAARMLAVQLTEIGLEVDVVAADDDRFFPLLFDPTLQVPLIMGNWFKDFPNASSFFPELLHGESIGSANHSLAGATESQLREWGYEVRSVPNVDDRIEACQTLLYRAQTRCWAQLDQYLIEQVVPWVPLTESVQGWLVSARVGSLSLDASTSIPMPAIERVELTGPPAAPPPAVPEPATSPIPDGVYRTTITDADLVAAGGRADDSPEDQGTYTLVLDRGRFFWHQLGREPIFNPVVVGRYEATEDAVTFEQVAPVFDEGAFSSLTWRLDGADLVFSLSECTGPAARDAAFCAYQRALFTSSPWRRVEGADPA
jgi:peptide/nickel transport system substrate-binding protein